MGEFDVKALLEGATVGHAAASVGLKDLQSVLPCTSASLLTRIISVMSQGESSVALTRSQFENLMRLLEDGSMEELCGFLFDIYDADGSGCLSEKDLTEMLQGGLNSSKLSVDPRTLKDAVASIMEELGVGKGGVVLREEFLGLAHRYPSLARTMESQLKTKTMDKSAAVGALTRVALEGVFPGVAAAVAQGAAEAAKAQAQAKQTPKASSSSSVRQRLGAAWDQTRLVAARLRNPPAITEAIMYLAILAMFVWGFIEHTKEPEFDLLGWGFPIAKGCAFAIRLSFSLLIITISFRTLTLLRVTFLRHLIPFDRNIEIHKNLGLALGAFSWMHSIAHFFNYAKAKAFAKANNVANPLPYHGYVAITGFIMLIVMTLVFFWALKWPRGSKYVKDTAPGKVLNNFNIFWVTHQILIFSWLVLLFMHPWPGLPGMKHHNVTWIFIAIPMLAFVAERVYRVFSSKADEVDVVAMVPMPGRVTQLVLRPRRPFRYSPGMYVRVCCPEISLYEWHPFTLSSAPDDPYITLHVRAAGDWTSALYEKAQAAQKDMLLSERVACVRNAAASAKLCCAQGTSSANQHYDVEMGHHRDLEEFFTETATCPPTPGREAAAAQEHMRVLTQAGQLAKALAVAAMGGQVPRFSERNNHSACSTPQRSRRSSLNGIKISVEGGMPQAQQTSPSKAEEASVHGRSRLGDASLGGNPPSRFSDHGAHGGQHAEGYRGTCGAAVGVPAVVFGGHGVSGGMGRVRRASLGGCPPSRFSEQGTGAAGAFGCPATTATANTAGVPQEQHRFTPGAFTNRTRRSSLDGHSARPSPATLPGGPVAALRQEARGIGRMSVRSVDSRAVSVTGVRDAMIAACSPSSVALPDWAPLKLPRILVDGPYGAPTQAYLDYPVLVLMAAGIGVTPMASILRDVARRLEEYRCSSCGSLNYPKSFWLRKIYFHWTVREQAAPQWFKETLQDVALMDAANDFCQINIHYTGGTPEGVSAVLLDLARQLHDKQHDKCLISGLRSGVKTHFGRPNMNKVMADIAREHPSERVGVMFCGPEVVAESVRQAIERTEHPSITLHKENF